VIIASQHAEIGFRRETQGDSVVNKASTGQKRERQPGRRRRRGRVTVFPNWCKGCNLCIEFCPTGVLEQGQDGRVIVAHPERCTACRWCELHCPDFAIFVQDLATEAEKSQAVSDEETA
jgi:2-oxoglutarate ferredoxin oxidoreductase subunit delta